MFTVDKKYVFNPFEGEYNIAPVVEHKTWMMIGEVIHPKITGRFIEVTTHPDCKNPHFHFSIMEKVIFHITTYDPVEKQNVVRQIENTINVFSVAIYPETYSDKWLMLMTLTDVKGQVEKDIISNVFNHYFSDKNYESAKKFISGKWRSENNPIPVFFPKHWEWMQNWMQNKLSNT